MFQKKEIENHFPSIICKIQNQYCLDCNGIIRNRHTGYIYHFTIKYYAGKEPLVKILNDEIIPNRNIHMYADKHLCLALPEDINWKKYPSISRYTIPWLVEWTIFHEIYKYNGGIWEGREAPKHFIFEMDNKKLADMYNRENLNKKGI